MSLRVRRCAACRAATTREHKSSDGAPLTARAAAVGPLARVDDGGGGGGLASPNGARRATRQTRVLEGRAIELISSDGANNRRRAYCSSLKLLCRRLRSLSAKIALRSSFAGSTANLRLQSASWRLLRRRERRLAHAALCRVYTRRRRLFNERLRLSAPKVSEILFETCKTFPKLFSFNAASKRAHPNQISS